MGCEAAEEGRGRARLGRGSRSRKCRSVNELLRRGERRQMARFFGLSPRESQIVGGLLDELTEAQIAAALGTSPHTVHEHMASVHVKLGACHRHGVVLRIFAWCLERRERELRAVRRQLETRKSWTYLRIRQTDSPAQGTPVQGN